MIEDELLTKKEAAKLLKVSLPTIDRMIRRGDFPIVRLSPKAVRIKVSDIVAFLERRTVRKEDT